MAVAVLAEPRRVSAEVREVTRSACTLDSVVVISSVSPAAKYSFSGSALRFSKGSTAIDAFAAAARAVTVASGVRGDSARVRRQASISARTAKTLARV